MADISNTGLSRRAFAVLLGSAAAGALVWRPMGIAHAQDTTDTETIVRSLRGRGKRSASPPEAKRETEAIERLRRIRRTRGLNLQEREELFEAARHRPQIDLTIYFDFDSAQVTPQGAAALNKLGQALASAELRSRVFGIFGHTDRKGTPEYNEDLSRRRAESARRYLVQTFGIDADTLVPEGFGFRHLKNPQNPFADENRRVQIVNLES